MRPTAMSNDLELYRERVRHEIMRRTGEPILNGSTDHAAVLIQECFLAAQEEVLLLSSRLDEPCFGRNSVRTSAECLLADPDRRLRILVERGSWDPEANFRWSAHPFIKPLLPYAEEKDGEGRPRLELRAVPADWVSRYKFNFLVVDEFGFRFQEDRDEPAAVAGFLSAEDAANVPNTVGRLRNIFEELCGHAELIELNIAA